jgi:RNA polymerase subunit RPABC4/transcription elongation factor Spt4
VKFVPKGKIMALKTCKECGKEISSGAGRCPYCGARHDYGGYAIGLIIVVVILCLYMCVQG